MFTSSTSEQVRLSFESNENVYAIVAILRSKKSQMNVVYAIQCLNVIMTKVSTQQLTSFQTIKLLDFLHVLPIFLRTRNESVKRNVKFSLRISNL